MPKPTLYLFIGFPGSGKTTIAKFIEEQTGAVHLWTDQERQKRFQNVTHSAVESAALYDTLNDRTAKLLMQGRSVVFDTNFNFRDDRKRLAAIAADASADLITIWVTTNRAFAKQRATHDTHRHRNGYSEVMKESTFDAIADRLEVPGPDETIVKIDGQNIDTKKLVRLLKWN
jgi:predicted kinase